MHGVHLCVICVLVKVARQNSEAVLAEKYCNESTLPIGGKDVDRNTNTVALHYHVLVCILGDTMRLQSDRCTCSYRY